MERATPAMTRAYVLMTAMPPTKGHLHLIQFAAEVGVTAEVIVTTQPHEPYVFERLAALRAATAHLGNVNIHHIHKTLPQEPEGHEGFWGMWHDFLLQYGLQPEDTIVASEMYGKKLAEISGTHFIPYDLEREVYHIRATQVRENPLYYFDHVLPEFQPVLRRRVTIFGAESNGKTTLSKALAHELDGHFIPEWARGYLMKVQRELTDESMTDIWTGQKALQKQARHLMDKPFIFQDTDLYSTLGYWRNWRPETVPPMLAVDASADKSSLYLIARSNIPFEADPIRYGGDKRESDDAYWIDFAEHAHLNYHVLESSDPDERVVEASEIIQDHFLKTSKIAYNRV